MVKVDPDWWKRLFDQTYLRTDARSVCDEALTSREVDFLIRVLNLKKTWPILDLCGGHGRHTLELCRRGFEEVTLLDYSEVLLDLARKRAQREGLRAGFVRGDARETGLSGRSFRVVIVMAGSFGYFVQESQNKRILGEAFRLLQPRGTLLLDLPDRDYVLDRLAPRSWHEAGEELLVCRRRTRDGEIVYTREIVLSKKTGLLRDETYSLRLYTPEKITALLTSAGFASVRLHQDFLPRQNQGDYGCLTNRMIVLAEKK